MAACQFNAVKASNNEVSNLYNQLALSLGQEEGMRQYLKALQLKNTDNFAVMLDANAEPVVTTELQRALGLVLTDIEIYKQTGLVDMINPTAGKLKIFTKAEQQKQLSRVNKELEVINSSRQAVANKDGSISIEYKVNESQSPFTGIIPSRIVGADKDNIIALKNYQILQANKRLAEIKSALKDTTLQPTTIQALVREKTDIVDRIRQLKLDGTKINTAGTFSNFFDIAKNDFDLLASLVNSNRISDIEQANIITDFYKRVGDFSSNEVFDHIIFGEALMDVQRDTVLVNAVWQQPFRDLAAQAAQYDVALENKKRKLLVESINTNEQVAALRQQGKINIQSFESIMEKAKDRSGFAQFLSVDTDNTLLGQVLHSQLEQIHENALLNFEKYRLKLDTLAESIDKLFKDNKWTSRWGISPDFKSIFSQIDEFGNETGNFITRYSTKWYSEKAKIDRYINTTRFSNWNIADLTLRFRANLILAKREQTWLNDNTVQMNTLQLEDVFNHPDLTAFSTTVQQLQAHTGYTQADYDAHKQELIDLIGQHEYTKLVAKQVADIKLYAVEYQNKLDDLNDAVTTGTITQAEADLKAQRYRLSHNPFLISYQFKHGVMQTANNEAIVQNWQEKNQYIPKNINGNYDINFDVIGNTPELLDFYETMLDINRELISMLPPKLQAKYKENSLLFVDRQLTEIILQNTNNTVSSIGKRQRNQLTEILTNIEQSTDYTGEINPVTGKRIQQTNSSNLSLREAEITKVNKAKKLQWFNDNKGRIITAMFNGVVQTQVIGDNSAITVDNYIPDDVKRQLFSESRAEVMSKKSWDLPTVIKLFAFYTSQLESREQMLPLMKLQKDFYDSIKNPVTNNLGSVAVHNNRVLAETLRDTANRNMTEWFNRVVLLNPNEVDKIVAGKKRYKYTTEDKELKRKYEEILKNELAKAVADRDLRVIDYATSELESLKQRVLTYEGIVDMTIKVLQIKGMAWNIPSMFTNIAIGTIGNFITAAENRTVKLDHMVKAYRIVMGSILKNLSFDKLSVGSSQKTRILMDRYRVLQDSTNEIQKASTNSLITHKLSWTAPLEGQRRGEYLNQAPLMIAKLMGEDITGLDGTVTNVWEAFDDNGQLLPNFRTIDNVQSWERTDESGNDSQYHLWKSSLDTAIVDTHGDYHELRGIAVKAYPLGKLLMMFKTWLPRAFYTRIGDEQLNIKLGYTRKGRYRSYTPFSAGLGTLIGMSVFINPFTIGGGLTALAVASLAGVTVRIAGGRRTTSLGKELTFTTTELVKNLLLTTSFGSINLKRDDGASLINGNEFTETDLANLKANLMELAFVCNYTMLLLIIKGLLYDDDDEKDSLKRKTHNLLVNQVAQITSDLTQYASVNGIKNMTGKAIPLMTTLSDLSKVVERAYLWVNDDDIIASGEDAGKSGLVKALDKAFVPSFITNSFGIERKTKRQFERTPYDKAFWSDEHLAKNKRLKDRAKERLEEKEEKAKEDEGL